MNDKNQYEKYKNCMYWHGCALKESGECPIDCDDYDD